MIILHLLQKPKILELFGKKHLRNITNTMYVHFKEKIQTTYVELLLHLYSIYPPLTIPSFNMMDYIFRGIV